MRILFIKFTIIISIVLFFLCGCEINTDEKSSPQEKIEEEINYIENRILTFFSMYSKKEYGEDKLNWDLIEENVIELNGTLDTVILDMYEINILSEDIIKYKDCINRLSIAAYNKDIINVLEEYRILYSLLPNYAENAVKNKNKVKQYELKSLVISSYVYANDLEWDLSKSTIDLAESKYKEMMDDVDYMKEYSYNLNKIFVLLSEVKNAIYLEELELTNMKYISFIEKI